MTIAEKFIQFNHSLSAGIEVPKGVEVLNPFANPDTLELSSAFYKKYYNDERERILVFGINPGRFGSGLTGVPFTDPVALIDSCGIPNELPQKKELSSDFIYRFLNQYGVQSFYRDFLITAVSPLGFMQDGKNLNYYDRKDLENMVKPFVVRTVDEQLKLPASKKVAVVIGGGKNMNFLEKLNREHRWFQSLKQLPHPRYIMQYKRKYLDDHLLNYQRVISEALVENK